VVLHGTRIGQGQRKPVCGTAERTSHLEYCESTRAGAMLALQIAQRLRGRIVREVGMNTQHRRSIPDEFFCVGLRRAQSWIEDNDVARTGI